VKQLSVARAVRTEVHRVHQVVPQSYFRSPFSFFVPVGWTGVLLFVAKWTRFWIYDSGDIFLKILTRDLVHSAVQFGDQR